MATGYEWYSSYAVIAPSIGGGVPPNQALRETYVSQDFGGLICYGMPTYTESEQANPDLDVNTFAPTALNVGQWLDACANAGMKYVTLVAKHHDGFALWPTSYAVSGYDPYSIAQTTWYTENGNPDIVELFVDGCRTRGLIPYIYFSILDTTYETRSGTDETSDAAGYLAMITAQITELLTNYGNIGAIWLDGYKWHLGYEEVKWTDLYFLVKGIYANTLFLDNNHQHPTDYSEIEIYEPGYIGDGPLPSGNTRLVEVVETIRDDLAWFKISNQIYRTSADILSAISYSNNNSATYTLGIQIGEDGLIHPSMVTLLGQVGA